MVRGSRVVGRGSFLFRFAVVSRVFNFARAPLSTTQLSGPCVKLRASCALRAIHSFLLRNGRLIRFIQVGLLARFCLGLRYIHVICAISRGRVVQFRFQRFGGSQFRLQQGCVRAPGGRRVIAASRGASRAGDHASAFTFVVGRVHRITHAMASRERPFFYRYHRGRFSILSEFCQFRDGQVRGFERGVIFPWVHAILALTLSSGSQAAGLYRPVSVVNLSVRLTFRLFARVFHPEFDPGDASARLRFFRQCTK